MTKDLSKIKADLKVMELLMSRKFITIYPMMSFLNMKQTQI